jgi:Tol biopolymer transport system component
LAVALAAVAALPSAAQAAYPIGQNGRIAFQSLRDGSFFDIFVMGSDGSSPINLTHDTPADSNPSFSPDGKHIIFATPDPGPGGDADIFTMNPDGSNRVNLTAGSSLTESAPVYFPDGQRIAFTRDVDPTAGTNFDVFVSDVGLRSPVDVTPTRTAVNDIPSDISPDGKRILFQTQDGSDSDFFTINPDGSSPVNLTAARPGFDADAVFTPDGKRVAMATDVDPTAGTNLDVVLISAVDGSGLVDITPTPAGDQRGPAPSPDGKRIAYEQGVNVFIAGIDGAGPVNITPGKDAHDPQWESVYTCGKRRATIIGSDAADVIKGTKRADVMVGNGGNDKLVGLRGNDRICGGAGKDKIKGDSGNDQLFGNAGKDKLTGGAGNDKVKGGAGRDDERR